MTSDLDRDRQLAALLDDGLDVPADALEERLSHFCDDPSLVAEAVAILRGENETHDLIPSTLPGFQAAITALDSATAPPATIGPYRIARMIGEGGMGVVYEAVQTEPIERRVAIKLMRSALTQPSERARFEVEQRALARLAHPNIAHMFEAGVTSGDRPYVVMELLAGEPITRYCDRKKLDIAQRLSLFVAVCRAIEHAHRRQLLHRDLKPSNVLVTDAEDGPVPKVIDFGIAKLLDIDSGVTLTNVGSLLGTPAYMSPEALEGIEADTRSDVYALGVLLYELLSGGKPFSSRGASPAEILQRAQKGKPTRPSRRFRGDPRAREIASARATTRRALRSALVTDLDWIVMHALAKDRRLRYPSAAALADDVERYLAHRPVAARPASLWYRISKLVRRHRAASIAAGLATIAAALAFGFGIRYTIDVRRERQIAEEARLQAEHLVTFLLDDLYEELAGLLRDRGDRTQAEQTFQRALEAVRGQPRELPMMVIEAQALLELGRTDEARAAAQQVIAAGWHETRPRLTELLEGAGFLPKP